MLIISIPPSVILLTLLLSFLVMLGSKWDMVVEKTSANEVKVSVNSQDGDDDSESDSSDDGGGSSKYDSADFQSSLKSFQMSESKRKRLRELEANELECGKRPRKSGMSIQQQVEHYRNKLLQKEFEKDEDKNERLTSKPKDRSKDDRRDRDRSKRSEEGVRRRGRSRDPDDHARKSRSISPLKQDKVSQMVQAFPITISRPEDQEVQVAVATSLP
ncbi:hypothetical protein F7725_006712 [Dissostichus mawsoni]|uniref:Uncharacterized protein n=1 Tax=Dissostichus mawsoni TaxID=36200 RepID=A0A7J5XUP1_DISMA|nr:hypothetical protein F7725_006712 [Dissostichus mawsoni]